MAFSFLIVLAFVLCCVVVRGLVVLLYRLVGPVELVSR